MTIATGAAVEGKNGRGPLAGARAWIISDGKAGHEAMCRGVAMALGLAVEVKRVAPKGIWRALAPWAPVAPRERFATPGTPFAPPWPAVVLAAGRITTPYIRALKRRAATQTYAIILMDPRTGPRSADLIWVPEHDALRGPNVISTLTSPHPFSPARLAEARSNPDPAIAALPTPRIAVLVGGPNDRYQYPPHVIARLTSCVQSLVGLGAGLMITTSRRTPAELVAALEASIKGTGAILWAGEGPNPYPQFLANADLFLVTADSINMAGEAATTGRPIYIFEPQGGADKFTAFHAAMRAKGITREAPDHFESLGSWSYTPLYAAGTIAREIEQRWQRRKSMLPGLT